MSNTTMPEFSERGCRGRLSVIIPTYDYATYLGGCLNSVLSQNVDDVEIIVVDDGSHDDPARVIDKFPGVILLQQDNQGLPAARNAGILASTGEFILFLDADDRLAPNTLNARLAYLARSEACTIAVCRNRVFSETDDADRPRANGSWQLPPSALDTRLLCFNIAPPHAWLIRRRVVSDTGLFDTSLRACEDYDYWLRALTHGHAPIYSPAGCVYYRKHSASMSANLRNQWHHDVILHGRVFGALNRSHNIGQHDRTSAILAACAGSFITLARGDGLAVDDRAFLLRLLGDTVASLPMASTKVLPENSLLAAYYRLLIVARARAAVALDASLRNPITRILDALADHHYLNSTGGYAGYVRTLTQLLGARGATHIDRYRVAKLLVQSIPGR